MGWLFSFAQGGGIFGGSQFFDVAKDVAAQGGVGLDDLVFLGSEFARLRQNGFGDADFADVMDEPGKIDPFLLLFG